MTVRRKPPEEDFWRKVINDMPGPFPEVGKNPPISEITEEDKAKQPGKFLKLSFEVFMFMPENSNKAYMIYSQQRMFDYGLMELSEALLKAKRKRSR